MPQSAKNATARGFPNEAVKLWSDLRIVNQQQRSEECHAFLPTARRFRTRPIKFWSNLRIVNQQCFALLKEEQRLKGRKREKKFSTLRELKKKTIAEWS